jgi:hypothetical protein
MAREGWAPTARLRLERRVMGGVGEGATRWYDYVLQQWHAPDVPGYLRGGEGEWRDVPIVEVVSP